MDKVTVSPRKVRALGNIVSPKAKNNFIGGKIVKGTDTINGVSNTVYTGSYLENGQISIECDPVVAVLTNFTLKATLKNGSGTAINNATIYCEVNNKTYSGSTNSSGVKSFNITGLPEGTYNCHIYYPGNNSVGGCFKNFIVVVSDEELELRVCGKSLIQSGEGSPIFAILTTNGLGVAGQLVEFYEEYDLTYIDIYSASSVINKDEILDITAKLKDEDMSLISGETVYFYEIYEINTITINSDKQIIETDEQADISAKLKDTDGSLIKGETVYFYVKEEE